MELNDDTWYLVKNCKKIASFVGGGKQKPVPITQIEVDRILKSVQLSSEKPKPRIEFVIGEKLRVIDGPFDDFVGQVEEIFYDKSRLRIGIEILGRMTPVELDFSQVEKEFI